MRHLHYNGAKIDRRRYIAFTTAIGTAIGLGAGALATAGGIGLVGAAGYGLSKILSQKTPKSETPSITALPTAPSVSAAEVEAKIDIAKKRKAIARNKTTYTSPFGLTPETKSDIALKTLTGV